MARTYRDISTPAATASPAAGSTAPDLPISTIAVDLSGAGAPREWRRDGDEETEKFLMGRLAGLASLADKGGVDLITLDETFHAAGRRRRDDWLDGAVAASRLARHTTSAGLVAAISLARTRPDNVGGAIASVHRASAGRAGWQLETGADVPPRAVDAVLRQWQGHQQGPRVVVPVRNTVDAELAAARADIARLSVATFDEARAARAAIRSAAQDWGRSPDDVRVLVDVHALISADAASAAARWDLLNSLEEAPKRYPLRSHGTASDLVDLWSSWVRGGAADGFTVIPASIPTDVVALVHEVIPALQAKGLRKPREAAAESVAAAPARPTRHATGHAARAEVRTGAQSAAGGAGQETSTLRG